MCTAASYRTKDLYFGRNLDYEFSYGDEVTITPRNYPFTFRRAGEMRTHYAMIGMAYVAEEYPLYYDAVVPIYCEAWNKACHRVFSGFPCTLYTAHPARQRIVPCWVTPKERKVHGVLFRRISCGASFLLAMNKGHGALYKLFSYFSTSACIFVVIIHSSQL